MAIKLQKEHIKLSEVLCSQYCQTTIENDIIVPDIKPDLLKILQVSSDVVVNQKNIQTDKVYIQGIIRLNILYLPDNDSAGNIHSIISVQDFSHSVDVKGAKPGMNLTVEAECEMPEHTLVNSRKLNVRNKIGLGIKITVPSEIDVASFVDGDEQIQVKETHMKICNAHSDTERDIIIREQLEVPAGKPDIAEILKLTAKPMASELRILNDKVALKGETKICTLYCSDDDSSPVQFMEHILPFSEVLEIEGLCEGMIGEIDFCVKDIYFEIRPDNDGDKRVLGIEITLCAFVKASEVIEFDALRDAYGIKRPLVLGKANYNLEQLIENCFTQSSQKEFISVPDYMPDIYLVFDCSAVPNIENITIENGCVTVSGFLNTNILYLAHDSSMPVASFNHTTLFSHTFDVQNIQKNSVCDAKADIEHLSYTINGARGLELRIVVAISLKAVNPNSTELICEMDWSEETDTEAPPSAVVYFVQKGDTLWDIAKRYRTTPDAIISDNGPEKDLIRPGNRIYIFR